MKTASRFAKTGLFVATIAMGAATLPEPAATFVVVEAAGQDTASVWDGRWQGATVSGQPLVLDVKVKEQRMTGKLMVGKQPAKITAGKALEQAFALATEKIDGHIVSATGRKVGDAIEFTIDGV